MLFSRPSSTTVFFLASAITTALASIENVSLLPTPPMGFNNWARFQCNLNEQLFVETADAMASNGLLAAGYDRLNLDDCWMTHQRAADGQLQWDPEKFPRGLIWLGQYFKARGFHFGIYEDAGNATCGGYPGSLGYEAIDAKTFGDWGIDYLKLDACNIDPFTAGHYKQLYRKWHAILSSSDKPLIFSESAPAYFSDTNNNTDWYDILDIMPENGELARHSDDIDIYDYYTAAEYWESIMTNYRNNYRIARYQQPGFYNDPDFLIADWPIPLDERKSQFALWASFSAPLIISADVPNLTKDEIAYLSNKDIIAVDQDALAQQATLVQQDANFDVLTKSLSNGDRLLTVLNKGDKTNTITLDLQRAGLPQGSTVTAKDLWTSQSQSITNQIKITLNTHATAIYRLSGVKNVTPTGQIFNALSYNCLTASGNVATFGTCEAASSQVWQISPRGLISPLSNPNKCLTAQNGQLSMAKCSPSKTSHQWEYRLTGNLFNKNSNQCLVEGDSGLTTCGFELDSQVFGLPVGVKVVRT
ncbi:putative alpha-galactosidase [Acrodontium crateriforme]|uniref:Alpha-galactosidase n=1 Tax=Acrodontium crateriforme TaxID=150365 RepID=A0AAQ3M9E2_9PEZI|nr:putative alpha-galactosidase [Acrodontium crateriforme]